MKFFLEEWWSHQFSFDFRFAFLCVAFSHQKVVVFSISRASSNLVAIWAALVAQATKEMYFWSKKDYFQRCQIWQSKAIARLLSQTAHKSDE